MVLIGSCFLKPNYYKSLYFVPGSFLAIVVSQNDLKISVILLFIITGIVIIIATLNSLYMKTQSKILAVIVWLLIIALAMFILGVMFGFSMALFVVLLAALIIIFFNLKGRR